MALSKVPHLRYLSLKGCANMKDSVPYASIATRFGFKKLEVRNEYLFSSSLLMFDPL